jgi:integrase
MLIRGVKRGVTQNKQKPAVTISHLKRLSETAAKVLTKAKHCRFTAMVSIAFYGFLRPSELGVSPVGHHLRRSSVKLGSKGRSLRLALRTYKHSTQPKLIYVGVARECCPVKSFKEYTKVWKQPTKAPLFDMSVQEFRETLAYTSAVAKIKTKLTPHCFRHGGATWAAKLGWSDAKIRAHGRWNSDAYKRYVRDS